MVPSTDGVMVAAYQLAEGRPGAAPVLAAHPTGLCAAVLGPVARLLGPHPVVAFDERGHGRSSRPASGSFAWSGFADDALAVVDAVGLDRPLGFGHSCGGAALVLAEARRPGTFAGLYLFEPVIPPLDEPIPGGDPGNRLSVGARRRRTHFAGRDDALANFAGKPPFVDFDPAVLAAYVDDGFRPDGHQGGITLRCARDDEAAVYAAAVAHDAFRHLPAIRCPVTIAYGARTDAFDERALRPVAERLPLAELRALPDLGHFGPQQDPAAVARSALRSAAWAASPPSPPSDPPRP